MYPYNFLEDTLSPYPILGNEYLGSPYIFDFTQPYYKNMPVRDVEHMNKHNLRLLKKSGKSWGIGGYLDDRSPKLIGTHILKEGRIFHLGIDVMTQDLANIYNPLDGIVCEVNYEEGAGNYGGYIIIQYTFSNVSFYALFGHMNYSSIKHLSGKIRKGEKLGQLGSPEQNGNWVPHLHLQVFTGNEFEKWKHRGYCTLEDLRNMQYICPHPGFLLRYFS